MWRQHNLRTGQQNMQHSSQIKYYIPVSKFQSLGPGAPTPQWMCARNLPAAPPSLAGVGGKLPHLHSPKCTRASTYLLICCDVCVCPHICEEGAATRPACLSVPVDVAPAREEQALQRHAHRAGVLQQTQATDRGMRTPGAASNNTAARPSRCHIHYKSTAGQSRSTCLQ